MSFINGNDDYDLQTSLRQENLDLKRRLNAQVEITKKLNTRVLKMGEDMLKFKSRSAGIDSHPESSQPHATADLNSPSTKKPPPTVIASRTVVHRRNPSMEALVDDLRNQLRIVAKDNSGLKSKLQHYKSMHEVALRKRGKWDSIGPRIPKGPVKHPSKSMSILSLAEPAALSSFLDTPQYADMTSTIQNLRHLVSAKEVEIAEAHQRVKELAGALCSVQADDSLEAASTEILLLKKQVSSLESRHKALTLDTTNKARLIEELLERCAKLEGDEVSHRHRHTELSAQLTHALSELDISRRRNDDLEVTLAQADVDTQTIAHLNHLVKELKSERDLAQVENSRILASLLETQESQKARNEQHTQAVYTKLAENEASHRELLINTERHLRELDAANEQLSIVTNRLNEATTRAETAQNELAELKNRVRMLAETNRVSDGDIHEALHVVAWRRQHEIPLDTLLSMHEWIENKSGAVHLRNEYMAALQDLDQTRQLLAEQEKSCSESQAELALIRRSLEELTLEYSRRREHDAQVMDTRQARIILLECQLRKSKTVVPSNVLTGKENSRLSKGPALTLQIHKWSLPPKCALVDSSITVFFTFDFFTFESILSQLAPAMTGSSLILEDWTASWPLDTVISDAFFWYLEEKEAHVAVDVILFRADGTFVCIGTAKLVHLTHLLHVGQSGLQCTLDVYGDRGTAKEWLNFSSAGYRFMHTLDSEQDTFIVGQIVSTLTISSPIQEAWKAYRERLRSAKYTLPETASPVRYPSINRNRTDVLTLKVARVDIAHKLQNPDLLYALVDVYHRTGLRIPCPVSSDITSTLEVPLVLAPDVVAWLSNQPMVVSLFGNDDPENLSSFLGQAKIMLASMLTQQSVNGQCDVVNIYSEVIGTITFDVSWQTGSGCGGYYPQNRSEPRVSGLKHVDAHKASTRLKRKNSLHTPDLISNTQRRQVADFTTRALQPPRLPVGRLAGDDFKGKAPPHLNRNSSLHKPDPSTNNQSGQAADFTTHTIKPPQLPIERPGGDDYKRKTTPQLSQKYSLGKSDSSINSQRGLPVKRLASAEEITLPVLATDKSILVSLSNRSINKSDLSQGRKSFGSPTSSRESLDSRPELNLPKTLLSETAQLHLSVQPLDASCNSSKESLINHGDECSESGGGSKGLTPNTSIGEVRFVPDSDYPIFNRGDSVRDESSSCSVTKLSDPSEDFDELSSLMVDLTADFGKKQWLSTDLSPSISQGDRMALTQLEEQHVTVILHTLRIQTQSSAVQNQLKDYTNLIVVCDIFNEVTSSSVETSARPVCDSGGQLVSKLDLGLVASYPVQHQSVETTNQWRRLVSSGVPSAFIVSVQSLDHEFVDVAQGRMFWDQVLGPLARDNTQVGHEEPLIMLVELGFMNGSGMLGDLVVEILGYEALMAL